MKEEIKMNNTNLSTLFGDIANSIRGKDGSHESIKPEQFPYKITNLPSGKETNVYKIERLKDIHNIKAKEHDIAVLSRTDKSDITDSFTGGNLFFESTVILNEPIGDEEYIDGMIRTDEGELMISGDITQVNIDFIGNSQLQILYTSDDGKTYNTQDTIEVIEIKNIHKFEKTIYIICFLFLRFRCMDFHCCLICLSGYLYIFPRKQFRRYQEHIQLFLL